MKFSEFKYVRPNADEVNAGYRHAAEMIENAGSFEEFMAGIAEYDRVFCESENHCTVAHIRNKLNFKDEFYREEARAIDKFFADTDECRVMPAKALVNSRWLSEFEAQYGENTVRKYRNMVEVPVCPPELQERENELSRRYDDLMDDLYVDYKGEKVRVHAMTDRFSDDDEVCIEAWCAVGRAYDTIKDELDEIYDELVKVRTEIANRAGYASYTDYAYMAKSRTFTKAEIAEFRSGVEKYFVPISETFVRQKAERIGKSYPLNYAENNLSDTFGQPNPIGTQEDTFNTAVKMYHDICPETAAYIDYMVEHELISTKGDENKATGGFCTDLPAFDAGYQFSHFSDTCADVNSITHEGGHAFAAFVNTKKRPYMHWSYSNEIAECHSQAMEMVCFPYMEWFFGDKADAHRYSHIMDSFTFIPYGCMVDHFQEEVYDHPEYTPADRVELWRSLMGRYMPWIKLGEVPFYGDARHWQRQPHIYTSPFYFIDYCLSEIVALQFFALLRQNREDGIKKYLELVDLGGTLPFVKLCKTVGMASPLSDEGVRQSAEEVSAWLDSIDVSAIK